LVVFRAEPGSHQGARPARARLYACKRGMIGSLPRSARFSEDGVWLHGCTQNSNRRCNTSLIGCLDTSCCSHLLHADGEVTTACP